MDLTVSASPRQIFRNPTTLEINVPKLAFLRFLVNAHTGLRVDTIKVGDIVGCVTLGANGLHSSMTLPAHYCHKVPAGITPSVAAALPMSLATAILALDLRAGLGRGPSKTVLVHSAAGGVGLCCVALLRMRGHDIIGTCNLRDDRKVEMLKSLGVSRIFDSRNVSSWYVPMMSGEAPRPEAIIGALDGDQFARSFEVVASNGYILDLAKKEQMLDQATVPLSHFLRGVTYSACHLDEFMRTAPPSEVTDLMNKVWETASAVGQSAMQSMPVSVYPGEHLKQALEVLTTGRNVGKVVVELEPPEGHVVSSDLVVDLRNSSDQVLLEGAALVVSTLESTFLAKAPTVTVRAGQKLPIDLLRSLVHLPAQGHAYVALSGPPELPALPVWHSCCESSSASTGTSNKLSILVTAVRQRSSAAALDGLSDEDLANMTLEELGFDSLARLQLSSLIRKLSPGGRSLVGSELVGHLPLSSIACTKPKSAGRSKSHRPRWLALHGFRMNGDFFAQQLAGLADFLGVEFVFVNAPHQAHGPGYGEKGGIADGFEWWWKGDSADTTYDSGWIGSEGLKTSQDFLRQQLERVKPEGVVGFSQGGGMAYWMLCRGLVKNGLIFSPVGPDTDESLSPQSESTVVVVRSTQKDEASAAYCQNVLKCDFLAHEEGHVVPSCGSEKYKELYDTVKKQLDL
ncbi:hypothetical protein FOL47_003329 [Perkinsus chesapeaki]|uniref:Enoyl reductase (ER) domain-containing protein n=1 Tax=Perkinsus chesapeaki TaxID=330153 RepID=A0A7J6M944_PERCH|nr:hypothetical protein FOL47_003329 [Perkinsus chesapeaki]